ncbi:MAG: GNAT family N-acetyltransferase [Bacteroidia bacterium]|nr:GNAT family N-acetyltransferase [Bacteroidia bacterium]NNK69791.1 GNAT family N-acetyltransferase [Flavobacteriaceae bacterium]NNL79643.1 GNAT family N-acetyltransferase [Flavobacteriaceae bacterium]
MIRKARTEDIATIMSITDACAKKLIQLNIFQWNDQYPNEQVFRDDIIRDELYVIEVNSKVIGCMAITEIKDAEYEPVKWLTDDGNSIYIHRLAVHPDNQGQGFARKLMGYAENHARENQKISVRLDTFSKNLRNQKFYETRGYTRLGHVYFPMQSDDPFYGYELLL